MNETAEAAAKALQLKAGRRRVTRVAGEQRTEFPFIHVGLWGPAKTWKTSTALRARTSEVRTAEVVENFEVVSKGEVLIPSRPLTIAFANFDRRADTVIQDIPEEFDIIEEVLYETVDGHPLSLAGPYEHQQLLDRFLEFVDESVAAKVDLIVCDGGTILWEDVRGVHLDPLPMGSKDPEGNARHAPRQYGPSNKVMRELIMKRLYNLPVHTVLTREAREKWTGANNQALDPNEPGGVALGADGWNKSDHYFDISMQMRLVKNPDDPPLQTGIVHMAIKPQLIGTTFRFPTFDQIYAAVMGKPLLKPEDQAKFDGLCAAHEGKLSWGPSS